MPEEAKTKPREWEEAEKLIPHRQFFPRSGHLQTLAGHFLPRRIELPAGQKRLFHVEQNVQVLCYCHFQPQKSNALTVLMVHGLEGSSESQYVLGTAAKAWSAGMNAVRMNIRNCGGSEALGPTLYHSGLSADLGAVVRTLISEDRLPRIALVGFSMGGNQVLKLAGEWGRDGAPPELRAVAVVSPAIDLAASANALHSWQNRGYEWNFLWGLKRRLRLKAGLFPGRFDLQRLRGLHSLRDFDDKITAHYCGFADADDYYFRASSARVLEKIAAPTLVIQAKDDPFIRLLPETRKMLLENPNIRLLETQHGGHCGFLAAANGYDGRWAERQV